MRRLLLTLLTGFAFLYCISFAQFSNGLVPMLGSSPKLKWDGVAMSSSGQFLAAKTASYPYSGQLYTSNDYGQTWDYKYNITLYGLATNSSGQLIVGIYQKSVFISSDYGDTYHFVPLNTSSNAQYLAMNAAGNYIYVCDYIGNFFRSNDSGASFTNITTLWAGSGSLYDVQTNDEGNFLIFSTNGVGIYRSFDYGDTWTLDTNGVSSFNSMSLDATGQYIFAATTGSVAYRSTNYGLDFSYISTGNKSATGSTTASSQNGVILYLASSTSVWVSFASGHNFTKVPITTSTSAPIRAIACSDAGTLVSAAIYSSTIAIASEVIPPTSQPSSQPTTVPSCMNGNGLDDQGGCGTCAPGTYLSSLGGVCEICPVGYYTADYGETECSKCEYPTKSVFDESDACDGFSLDANITTTLIVMGALSFVVLLCVLTSIKKVAVMVNLIFPTLDLFSDIAYLMTNDFYSPILFALGVLCVIFPVPGFFYIVYKQKAVIPQLTWRLNRIWWLSAGQMDQDHIYYAKFPCFGGDERFPLLSCVKHDNLLSLTLECLVWVIAIISQILTIVGYPVMILCNILFLFFWIFVGIFLHLTKTLAVGNVWNMWFSLWTGTDKHNTDVDVDTEALNGSLQHEFYFETLPQVLLQLVNNILLKDFTPLAIFSLVQSLVMALNGIWRFGYYRYVVKDPVPLKDIPIDMTIRFKLERFGIDLVLLDGRLNPSSKSDKAGLRESLIVDDEGKKIDTFAANDGSSRSGDGKGSGPSDSSKKRDSESGGFAVEGVGTVVDAITSIM